MIKDQLIFEKSRPGRRAYSLPETDIPGQGIENCIPVKYLRQQEANLPELSEVEIVRHFTNLSQKNHGVDAGFYPLGSCTMKYNPKINEDMAALEGFTAVHPYEPDHMAQGSLRLMYELSAALAEITGMDGVSLQPAAGAHGELTGMMIIKAYHEHNGQGQRTKMMIPDAAHGTNPASAAMAGFQVVQVKSDANGNVDLDALRSLVGEDTAGLMLTNPNTLGLFEENIVEIAQIIHDAGGLLYYDGANANAILGIARPGDMGFDVVHLNLHKTFSTPHGGGGPGAGPVGVKKDLLPFLPSPVIGCVDGKYVRDYDRPLSIGQVKSFYGNFAVCVKAYAYILSLGAEGIRKVAEGAVLNANYLMHALKEAYLLPYDRTCMHEFVLSGDKQKAQGCTTQDVAKRLLDFGIHPPTVYFPLIVHEAMMIEPTETESKETLDEFIAALLQIAQEVEESPDFVKAAPHTTVVKRLDEVRAVKQPVFKYTAE